MERVSVVFCFNDSFCIFSAAAISSLIRHTSNKYIYDIYIVHYDISDYNQHSIQRINDRDNVNIKFIYFDPKKEVEEEGLYTWAHFSVDVYTRLFLHKIFPKLEKLLFLDGDIIITEDIANLFNEDIGDHSVGACLNFMTGPALERTQTVFFPKNHRFASYGTWYNYLREHLSLSDNDILTYFNAGVILFNLKKAGKILDEAIKLMDRGYYYNDQDLLNMVFKNDKVLLDSKYNIYSHLVSDYIEKHKKLPNIIHFIGGSTKPTYTMLRESDIAFWKTISETDFYYPALEKFVNNKLGVAKRNLEGQINQVKASLSNPGALEDLYYNLRRTHKVQRRRRYLRVIIKLLVDSKKYKKLKNDPGRFFEDSKSSFIRFLGRYYI